MEIIFEKDYLRDLYETGKAKKKKHNFQKAVIRKFIQKIDMLRNAQSIDELYPIKSLNYEKLVGDKKGFESIRVDNKYRIEFISSTKGKEPDIITICSIYELSNHYK